MCVDRDYNHLAYNPGPDIVKNQHIDANLGSNLTVDYSNNTTNLYDDTDANVDQEVLNMENGTSEVVDYEKEIHIPTMEEQSEVTEIPGNQDSLNESGEVDPATERERLLNKTLIDRDRIV